MKPAEFFDTIAPVYDGNYQSAHSLFEDKLLKEYLLKNDLVKGRILDVGCGTGHLIELFTENNNIVQPNHYQYVGIDPSEGMLQLARKKFPGYEFIKMGVEDMNDLRAFDNILVIYGSGAYSDIYDLIKHFMKRGRRGAKLFIMNYAQNSVYRMPPGNENMIKRFAYNELFDWCRKNNCNFVLTPMLNMEFQYAPVDTVSEFEKLESINPVTPKNAQWLNLLLTK